MRVLVTGASGFVGGAVCPAFQSAGHHVRAAVRRPDAKVAGAADHVLVPDIGPDTDWRAALENVDVVVHLAARVHEMGEQGEAAVLAHRRVNAEGTRRLAEAAATAGVRRLLFMSTIKVHGEASPGRPFTERDPPAPEDAYGKAKWAAEQALADIASRTPLEATVLRPPLVYGPGATGNLRSLLRLCDSPLPLPFGAVANRRSMIGRGNLAHAVVAAACHPRAAGQTYLVRDGEDLSLADLIRRVRRSLGRPARLLPAPPGLIRAGLAVLGRGALAARLLDSLTLDDAKLRGEVGWSPPGSVDSEVAAMARWYIAGRP